MTELSGNAKQQATRRGRNKEEKFIIHATSPKQSQIHNTLVF